MKPFHRVGSLPFLSGHLAQIGERITHRGRLGDTLSIAGGTAPEAPGYFSTAETRKSGVGGQALSRTFSSEPSCLTSNRGSLRMRSESFALP